MPVARVARGHVADQDLVLVLIVRRARSRTRFARRRIPMGTMSRHRVLRDGDQMRIARIARRDVADRHLWLPEPPLATVFFSGFTSCLTAEGAFVTAEAA